MNPGEILQCCNSSYCNNFEKPTTAAPTEHKPTTMTIAEVVASTGNQVTESTSGE